MAGKADAVKKVADGASKASKVSETQEKANKVKKTAETISNNTPTSNSGEKGMKDAVVDAASAVANYYSGNYVGAAASAVEVVKNKKARKFSLVSTIISIVAPILIIVMLGLFFMQIINSIGDTVSTVVSTMSSFISGTGNWFTSLFDQTSGKLVININEDKFKELKNSLKAQAIDTEASSLTDECLKLFLLAQYKTQYPEDVIIKIEISENEKKKIEARGRGNYIKTENGKNYIQTSGCIELKRPEFTNGKLKYVQEETLKAYENSTDKNFDDIKDKYSISQSGNIIIPEKSIEKYIEGEDEGQAEWKDLNQEDDYNWENFNTRTPTSQTTKITLKPIPYQSTISSYTMPFEFLTILTTFTQNSEYGVAMAELVNNKSIIKLNILDNSKTTEERYTYQYISNSKIQYRVGAKAKLIDGAVWGHKTSATPDINDYHQGDIDSKIIEEMLWKDDIENYEVEKPRIYRENTIKTEYTSSLQLEKAETWFAKKETSYAIEEIPSKLDEKVENNPDIKSLPENSSMSPLNINKDEYASLQELYDKNEQFKNFIENIYKRDTGYSLQDFKNKLIEAVNKQKMVEFVDKYVEEDLKKQFYELELGMEYNPNVNIFPLQGDQAKQYNNLISAINDYKSRSQDWKIDRNSYDIMPSYITNVHKDRQSRTAFYVSEKKYNVNNAGQAEDNTDEFINLLIKKVGNKKVFVYYKSQYGGESAPVAAMISAPDMLFELIANNSKVANMENAMRYIMYKITGTDFGVTDFSKALYTMQSFGTGNVLYDYIRMWENMDLYLYHIGEQSSSSYATANHYKTIGNDTGVYIAYGVGLNQGWNDDVFSTFGVMPSQLRSYTQGDMEFKELNQEDTERAFEKVVDKIKQNAINSINADILSELSEDQINALATICYEYGNIGNFNSVYHLFKEGKESEFKSSFVANGTTPFLSGDGGATARANANFDVFKNANYACGNRVLDKNSYKRGSGSGKLAGVIEYAMSNMGKTDSDMGVSFAWCAWYVQHCFNHEGYDASILFDGYQVSTSKALNFAQQGKFKKREEGYIPQCGDVILYGPEGNLQHTGMVVDSDGSQVHTIEGNTSGGIVGEHYYELNNTYIYGYFLSSEIF